MAYIPSPGEKDLEKVVRSIRNAHERLTTVETDLNTAEATIEDHETRIDVLEAVTHREVLSADRTYYVRADGSDSNDGLANTSGGAFLTVQKAIDVCQTIDLAGNAVTLQVGNGTYTGAIGVDAPFVGGIVTLTGDTTTPSNVVISVTSDHAIHVQNGAALSLKGLKVSTTTSGSCLVAEGGGIITITGKMDFGACASAHVYANYAGAIVFGSHAAAIDYTISGGAGFHYIAQYGGFIEASPPTAAGNTVTLTGTPNFSSGFAFATDTAALRTFNYAFSGAATGKRYSATMNGTIQTAGGGANYFPGNAAGTTATGGQYA